jgi:hypothetical protein
MDSHRDLPRTISRLASVLGFHVYSGDERSHELRTLLNQQPYAFDDETRFFASPDVATRVPVRSVTASVLTKSSFLFT